jgi:hypothetical protein
MAGFLAALFSTLTQVLQSTYTKSALKGFALDPMVFHMYCSIVASTLLMPYVLFSEAYDFVFGMLSTSVVAGVGIGDDQPTPTIEQYMVVISLLCHYAQNLASIYFLSHVNVLSHQVAGTFKRLIVIIGSVIYFQTPVSLLNCIGMVTALAGFFWYSVEHKIHKHHHHHQHRHHRLVDKKSADNTPTNQDQHDHAYRHYGESSDVHYGGNSSMASNHNYHGVNGLYFPNSTRQSSGPAKLHHFHSDSVLKERFVTVGDNS